MMDIFANILVLTYSNANFFGGANRFLPNGFVSPRFGDPKLLMNGNLKGYLGGLTSQISNSFKDNFGLSKTNNGKGLTGSVSDLLGALSKVGGTMLGNVIGGFLNDQLGSAPAYQAVPALITGEPTGNWHLTVGNPINPIAMIGNLVLKNSIITFNGVFSNEDFPTEMKLVVELEPGRPRDKSDFESMFNAGKGRLYASAKDYADFLNLEGKDVYTRNAVQFDKNNKQYVGNNNAAGSEKVSDSNTKKKGNIDTNRFPGGAGYIELADKFINF